MTRKHLPRRTFLRGVVAGGGALSVGLPLLEAMLDVNGKALADGTPLPKCFAVWFWGNGTIHTEWFPRATGPGWTPSRVLSPIADVAEHVHVVSGTTLPIAGRFNKHVEGPAGILVGAAPTGTPHAEGANDWQYLTVPGPSIDEVAADHLGTPAFRSIVAAVTPPHDTAGGPGTAITYGSHRGPYAPNPPARDPRALFMRLFGAGLPGGAGSTGPDPRALARRSVLDAVRGDAASLRLRLGARDRERLDRHLDGIRDLERRLDGSAEPGRATSACALPRAEAADGSDRERNQLFAEITAMAFACDLTRVASIQFSSPASHSPLPDIFSASSLDRGSFHEHGHLRGYDDFVVRGVQYLTDRFGDFVRALLAVREGDGSLLDRCVVLGTSDIADGPNHGEVDWPLLVAGHGGLARRGTHVRMVGENASRVPLTCLRALGWRGESWGSGSFRVTEAVAELLA